MHATPLNLGATLPEGSQMPEPSSKTESEPFAWKQAVDNHRRPVLRS
jgi:hypothetical protein